MNNLNVVLFSDDNDVEEYYEELKKEYPICSTVHMSYLQSVDPLEPKKQLPLFSEENLGVLQTENFKKLITICDEVLNSISEEKLLIFFAVKVDLSCNAASVKT